MPSYVGVDFEIENLKIPLIVLKQGKC